MIRLWSVATGELCAHLDGQSSRLHKAVFSADGQTLAACGSDNHVRLWAADEIVIANPNPGEN